MDTLTHPSHSSHAPHVPYVVPRAPAQDDCAKALSHASSTALKPCFFNSAKAMLLQGSADSRGDNFVAHFEAESGRQELQAKWAILIPHSDDANGSICLRSGKTWNGLLLNRRSTHSLIYSEMAGWLRYCTFSVWPCAACRHPQFHKANNRLRY